MAGHRPDRHGRMSWPGSYGAQLVEGQFRIGSDAGRLLGLMGFNADVWPEEARWPVEAHG
jgi:hypothetical protein